MIVISVFIFDAVLPTILTKVLSKMQNQRLFIKITETYMTLLLFATYCFLFEIWVFVQPVKTLPRIRFNAFFATLYVFEFNICFLNTFSNQFLKLPIILAQTLYTFTRIVTTEKMEPYQIVQMLCFLLMIDIWIMSMVSLTERNIQKIFELQKKTETTKKNYENILNELPQSIIVTDLEKEIVFTNKASQETLFSKKNITSYNNIDWLFNLFPALNKYMKLNGESQSKNLEIKKEIIKKDEKEIYNNSISLEEVFEDIMNKNEQKAEIYFAKLEEFIEKSNVNTPLQMSKCFLKKNREKENSIEISHKKNKNKKIDENYYFKIEKKNEITIPLKEVKDYGKKIEKNKKEYNIFEKIKKKMQIFDKVSNKNKDINFSELDNEGSSSKISSKKIENIENEEICNEIEINKIQKIDSKQNIEEIEKYLSENNEKSDTKKEIQNNYLYFEIKLKKINFNNKPAIMLIFENITNLVESMKENDEFKTRMLASFSHNLRTPLNGAISPLENCILDKQQPISLTNKYLNYSYKSLLNLESFLNDVVDFSLIISNKFMRSDSHFSIRDLANECFEQLKLFASIKSLFLKLEIDENIPLYIRNDRKRIKQVIVNLISNAIKFTYKGGVILKIAVEKTIPEMILKVYVKDTGIGISGIKQSKLSAFLQNDELHQSLGINSTGIGLGLLMAHKLSKLFGFKKGIFFKSKEKIGSIFGFFIRDIVPTSNTSLFVYKDELLAKSKTSYFSFIEINKEENVKKSTFDSFEFDEMNPESTLNRDKLLSLYTSSNIPKNNNFEKEENYKDDVFNFIELGKHIELKNEQEKEICLNCKDVLIVDDDGFNVAALEMILKKHNINFFTKVNLNTEKAFNGQEAIDLILKKYTKKRNCLNKCSGLRLIFMDYQMPVMDGVEAAKRLRKLKQQNIIEDIPIIACTAFGAKENIEECNQAGMVDFVNKPINYNLVVSIIENHLN